MSSASILACHRSGYHIVALEKDSDIFNVHLKSMGDPTPLRSTPRLAPTDLDEPPQSNRDALLSVRKLDLDSYFFFLC